MVSNNPSKGADVFLFVQDPDPTHVGRNIVTLDKETKDLLNITSGDIVVEGEKKPLQLFGLQN